MYLFYEIDEKDQNRLQFERVYGIIQICVCFAEAFAPSKMADFKTKMP